MAISGTDTDPERAQSGQRGAFTLGGVGALVLAAISFGWVLYSALDVGIGNYLLAVVNIAEASIDGSDHFRYADTESLVDAVAFGLAGGLALAWRRVARGALIAVSGIAAYKSFQQLVGVTDERYRNFLIDETKGVLTLLTNGVTLLVTLVILAAMVLGARTVRGPIGGPGGVGPGSYPPGPGGWQQLPQPYPQQPYPPQQPPQPYGRPEQPKGPQPGPPAPGTY